jgi:hypothetical protein
VRNLLVLALLYLAQAVRMRREEAMLRAGDQQAAYANYCAAVRYRIVPFVFQGGTKLLPHPRASALAPSRHPP